MIGSYSPDSKSTKYVFAYWYLDLWWLNVCFISFANTFWTLLLSVNILNTPLARPFVRLSANPRVELFDSDLFSTCCDWVFFLFSITFIFWINSISYGCLWMFSIISIYLDISSTSCTHKIIITRSLILSIKAWFSNAEYFYVFLYWNGISYPKILSISYLFSPLIFLELIISSSMSWYLSKCLSFISVNIFDAILTCISIFFFYSVI